MVAYCGRCKRRKVVEFELPEEVKRLLLLYRWKEGVCLPCVDELAEKGGIHYRPEHGSDHVVRSPAGTARATNERAIGLRRPYTYFGQLALRRGCYVDLAQVSTSGLCRILARTD
jgi:hypothetical protein